MASLNRKRRNAHPRSANGADELSQQDRETIEKVRVDSNGHERPEKIQGKYAPSPSVIKPMSIKMVRG